jgi:hypothetical protein
VWRNGILVLLIFLFIVHPCNIAVWFDEFGALCPCVASLQRTWRTRWAMGTGGSTSKNQKYVCHRILHYSLDPGFLGIRARNRSQGGVVQNYYVCVEVPIWYWAAAGAVGFTEGILRERRYKYPRDPLRPHGITEVHGYHKALFGD